ANTRIVQLTRAQDEPVHTWIQCHGWRCLGDNHQIATVFMTVGLVCPKDGSAKPEGENAPASEALRKPGGASLEMLTHIAGKRVDEMYSAFDFTDPSGANTDPVILSYGESVSSGEAVNFQPFVQRAEK